MREFLFEIEKCLANHDGFKALPIADFEPEREGDRAGARLRVGDAFVWAMVPFMGVADADFAERVVTEAIDRLGGA